jgi:hypothetical protein
VCVYLQGTFREQSENNQGTFRRTHLGRYSLLALRTPLMPHRLTLSHACGQYFLVVMNPPPCDHQSPPSDHESTPSNQPSSQGVSCAPLSLCVSNGPDTRSLHTEVRLGFPNSQNRPETAHGSFYTKINPPPHLPRKKGVSGPLPPSRWTEVSIIKSVLLRACCLHVIISIG